MGPRGERGLGLEPPKLLNNSFNDRTMNLSDSATFTCVFFGNPIPQVSWNSSAHQFQVTSSIDKQKFEITSRLTISNIKWEDRGTVSCHGKSILGADSGIRQLNVLCRFFHAPFLQHLLWTSQRRIKIKYILF